MGIDNHNSVYAFEAESIDGKTVPLRDYQGSVLLIVNTASQCGFTPQYDGLQTLWKKYAEQGLTVIGFPCNQFGAQEPGNSQEIASFCQINHGVDFPMMAKIVVNGPDAHPLYQWLVNQSPGVLGTKAVKWNFTKFLIGRNGQVLKRYGSMTSPNALEADIELALQAPLV